MPRAPTVRTEGARRRTELHEDGWTRLEGGIPDWELKDLVERLHRRHSQRIIDGLEALRARWMDGDGSGPGSGRPGSFAASKVNEQMKGTGIFVYAAHPSQADDNEDESYSGPRWYITCSEAVMKHYEGRGVAPPPPNEMQDILWPRDVDRNRPWLTEIGWTLVPEGQFPQVMHADICSESSKNARKGLGRYHHFAWKLKPEDMCTTNVVSGGFSEGCATWDDYEKWSIVRANAVIFDSEMLHRGGKTAAGSGWTQTMTIQVCSGAGWNALQERVSAGLMWYTQPLGWEQGAAVDALVDGVWQPGFVESRGKHGNYSVTLASTRKERNDLRDCELRYREAPSGAAPCAASLAKGARVQALADGAWCPARLARANGDGTFRVVWCADRSFSDGLCADAVRAAVEGGGSEPSVSESAPRKRKDRKAVAGEDSTGKRQKTDAQDTEALRLELVSKAFVELPSGLPDNWQWELFRFVEACYDRFNDLVIQELDSLRTLWAPCKGSQQRHGAFAAQKVNERLKAHGVAVYSPGPSQQQVAPWESNGPRWYVSVTMAAFEHFGASAPAPPTELWELLCGHSADAGEELRARGVGWTLAPPGSDPQALHADIFGTGKHARLGDRTRWPHLLWKRDRGKLCTTEIVPEGFTDGLSTDAHFDRIQRVRAPAIVVDSEALHRGAATPASPNPGVSTEGWTSTLSLELCTHSGWLAWEDYQTGGTTKDPSSSLDWRMLVIQKPAPEGSAAVAKAGTGAAKAPALPVATLPPAPWRSPAGLAKAAAEQRSWEFSG